jgi:hypothetical protein
MTLAKITQHRFSSQRHSYKISVGTLLFNKMFSEKMGLLICLPGSEWA